MAGRISAVFDCMVFVQAAARHGGPARACFEAVRGGDVRLYVGRHVLLELRDVLGRPELRSRFSRLTDERVERFVEEVLACAVWVETVPAVYRHPLDSKDEPYVNLAVACNAGVIVSRDRRHMLSLMDKTRPEGLEFASRFPDLRASRRRNCLRNCAGQRRTSPCEGGVIRN